MHAIHAYSTAPVVFGRIPQSRAQAPRFSGENAQPDFAPKSLRARMLGWLLKQAGVCIYTGTFDPFHAGHKANILEARKLGYKYFIVVPSDNPQYKKDRADMATEDQRAEMIKLGTRDIPGVIVMKLDSGQKRSTCGNASADGNASASESRKGESFLKRFLNGMIPKGAAIPLIVGDDALKEWDQREYDRFMDPDRFLFLQTVRESGDQALDEVNIGGKTYKVETKPLITDGNPISSTQIRNRIKSGESTDGLIAPAVKAFIEKHGLYRKK